MGIDGKLKRKLCGAIETVVLGDSLEGKHVTFFDLIEGQASRS